MKKSVLVMLIAVMATMFLAGCSQKEVASVDYIPEEIKAIEVAEGMIEKEYDVKINRDDYSYSVGKQIRENEFVPLYDETEQEESSEGIVSVSALSVNEVSEGELVSFAVVYNEDTDEVITISRDK